jgi:hypothetical protein
MIKLLTLLAVVSFLASAQMSFNLNAATYQVQNGFYALYIPTRGGVSPATYNYQAYPATWQQSGNSLLIPVLQTNPGSIWALKVIVTDALGNKLQRSLVIKISNGGDPLIGDYSYDQTFTFSSSGAITSIPTSTSIVTSSTTTNTSTESSSSSSSANGASFGSTSSATGVITLQASGTGVSTTLPGSS